MPAMLLHQVDARAGPLDLAADGGRDGEPVTLRLGEIFDRRVDGAVELDQRLHHVVDRLEQVRAISRLPARQGEDVVAGLGLRLRRDRQQQLVALRRDVVDLDLDLLLRRPFLDQRLGGVVGARHPMVPEADRELAGRV